MIKKRKSFFGMIGFNGFCLLVFVVLVGVSTYIQYAKENTVTVTVQSITTQQHVSGHEGNVITSYTYLVGTDMGTMEISPDGIMCSSAFGKLQEGKRYRIHTRGFSFPMFGIYPYIVDAEED